MTTVADWYNWADCGCNGITIDPQHPDWIQAHWWLLGLGGMKIRELVISGHGGPGSVSPFNVQNIKDPNSDAYKFLQALAATMADEGKITIKACNVARGSQGEEFIKLMAQLTQSDVVAYTDWYAVTPHGNEITAHPDGTLQITGRYPPYKGSWPERLKRRISK